MGLLARILRKSKGKQFEGNVAFIGLSYAGKTTILNRLRYDQFEEDTLRTMGLNVDNFEYKGIKFSAFDLGGQETFRMIWEPYLKTSIAVCFVIDSSSPESYVESAEVLRSMLRHIPSKATLLLLANKNDLAPTNALAAIITAFNFKELQETADLKAINLFYISAKTGDQFSEAFDWLSEVVTDTLKKNDYRRKFEVDDVTRLKIKQNSKVRKDLIGPGGMRF
ncbi:MAG: GTPase HflX [Candidatus Heimdallarchaeota archaeon LC_3]|nr:MAG: GTPase HflX [Candidatus Heimdallarchaeota archaeon LC_3]